jgi:LysR family transcriptional regulator, low CO2-responsive transcriptional regulator
MLGPRGAMRSVAALFAEYFAPGLIELFTGRAADLDVELSVHPPQEFSRLLMTRSVDVALGPQPSDLDEAIARRPFLNYQVIVVADANHPMAQIQAGVSELRDQTWLLGPSAAAEVGLMPMILRRLMVPDDKQQIFQSHSAALDEARRGTDWRSPCHSRCPRTSPPVGSSGYRAAVFRQTACGAR